MASHGGQITKLKNEAYVEKMVNCGGGRTGGVKPEGEVGGVVEVAKLVIRGSSPCVIADIV